MMFATRVRALSCLSAAGLCCLPGCAPPYQLVSHGRPAESRQDTFGYRKWISREHQQDVVLIGIHGFCGASLDYTNLGNYLLRHQPQSGLYAYEVRGQGSDPILARRGDIGDPREWYQDLFAFTQLVRERHPEAKVVWFGESMGAMIAAHAWHQAPKGQPPCDALVLSSPIVRFRDDIPAWTPGLVRVAATTLPLARISLDALAGGQQVQMTQQSTHGEQVKNNPYHVEQHTLRLIGTLSHLITTMNDCAARMQTPLLILHGGLDFFNNDADLRGFVARVPQSTSVTYHNYPKAYHLLMYDERKEAIFRDVTRWLNRLRGDRLRAR